MNKVFIQEGFLSVFFFIDNWTQSKSYVQLSNILLKFKLIFPFMFSDNISNQGTKF